MKKTIFLCTVVLFFSTALPISAKVSRAPQSNVQLEARQGFEQILDLWREGKYDELYLRTIVSGKHSKESFTRKLAASERRPACCWEKMQDVSVTEKYDDRATIRAKIGVEGKGGEIEFHTKTFKLAKEEGYWRISMTDLFFLAGTEKKTSKRYKKGTATFYY